MGSSCFPDDEPHLRDMHRFAGGREFTLTGKGRPKHRTNPPPVQAFPQAGPAKSSVSAAPAATNLSLARKTKIKER
jgi:hypothetical protein